jgi:hypothetical protein
VALTVTPDSAAVLIALVIVPLMVTVGVDDELLPPQADSPNTNTSITAAQACLVSVSTCFVISSWVG